MMGHFLTYFVTVPSFISYNPFLHILRDNDIHCLRNCMTVERLPVPVRGCDKPTLGSLMSQKYLTYFNFVTPLSSHNYMS